MFLVILLYAFVALTFPLSQFAVNHASYLFIITVRMLLAGLLLLMYQYFIAGKSIAIKKSDLALFGMTSIFHIYLAFVFEFWALQYLPSLKVNIMFCMTPLVSAIFDYFLCAKKLTRNNSLGMMLGFIGMVPLIVCDGGAESFMKYEGFCFLPEIVLAIAIASGAFAWFLVSRLNSRGYSCSMINGVSMLTGGALSGITGFIIGDPGIASISNVNSFWLSIVGLILVSNIIVYNLYTYLLSKYSITFISLAGFLSPVFGAVYAWLFFSEAITLNYLVSAVLISLGLVVFYKK